MFAPDLVKRITERVAEIGVRLDDFTGRGELDDRLRA